MNFQFLYLGTKAKISGANLFMRLNYWVVFCGGSIMTTPPSLTGVDAPASAAVAISASAMTFTLSAIPESVTNLKLIICAPTSAYPKVFFRYFYVNTTTGEKSGEVLVEGKLSAE